VCRCAARAGANVRLFDGATGSVVLKKADRTFSKRTRRGRSNRRACVAEKVQRRPLQNAVNRINFRPAKVANRSR
jgi:hypothetical protein